MVDKSNFRHFEPTLDTSTWESQPNFRFNLLLKSKRKNITASKFDRLEKTKLCRNLKKGESPD